MRRWWDYYIRHQLGINLGLSLMGIIFGFIVYFFPYMPKPILSFYIQQQNDVFKLNKHSDKLKVFYNDLDIRKNSQDLRFYKIRIQNDGDAAVEEGSYASQEPFGLSFKDAFVLSVDLIPNNDEYVSRNMHAEVKDSTKVILGKLILEKGNYYECEILVLYKENILPRLSTIGKITGQKEISISNEPYIKETDALKGRLALWALSWKEKFSGTTLYLWLLLMAVIILIAVMQYIKKRELLRLYKKQSQGVTPEKECLSYIFTRITKEQFRHLLDIFLNAEFFKTIYHEGLAEEEFIDKVNELIRVGKGSLGKNEIVHNSYLLFAVRIFIEKGFVAIDPRKNIIIPPAMVEEIKIAKSLLFQKEPSNALH